MSWIWLVVVAGFAALFARIDIIVSIMKRRHYFKYVGIARNKYGYFTVNPEQYPPSLYKEKK